MFTECGSVNRRNEVPGGTTAQHGSFLGGRLALASRAHQTASPRSSAAQRGGSGRRTICSSFGRVATGLAFMYCCHQGMLAAVMPLPPRNKDNAAVRMSQYLSTGKTSLSFAGHECVFCNVPRRTFAWRRADHLCLRLWWRFTASPLPTAGQELVFIHFGREQACLNFHLKLLFCVSTVSTNTNRLVLLSRLFSPHCLVSLTVCSPTGCSPEAILARALSVRTLRGFSRAPPCAFDPSRNG